jgi:hypothetical protein
MEKKHILFISSITAKDNQLRVIDELGVIEPLWLEGICREEYLFMPKLSVKTDKLSTTILNSNGVQTPLVLHFSLHGDKEQGLKFIGRNNNPVFQSKAYFESLLEEVDRRKQRINCILFNACHSAELAEIMSPFVDFTVGVEGAIADSASVEFSRGFYRQLFLQHPDDDTLFPNCFSMGRMSVQEWTSDEHIQIEDEGLPYHKRFVSFSQK